MPPSSPVFSTRCTREPLVGQRQGGRHAGDAAADHQGRVVDRHGVLVQRQQSRRAGHGHADQVDRLVRRLAGLSGVHPGALVADVGHFQQVGIQAGIAQRVAEDRLVGPRGARGHDDAVQAGARRSAP